MNALQVGIALRTIGRGYIPDKSFIIVTVVITLVLMVGWRTGLAALTPEQVTNSLLEYRGLQLTVPESPSQAHWLVERCDELFFGLPSLLCLMGWATSVYRYTSHPGSSLGFVRLLYIACV